MCAEWPSKLTSNCLKKRVELPSTYISNCLASESTFRIYVWEIEFCQVAAIVSPTLRAFPSRFECHF